MWELLSIWAYEFRAAFPRIHPQVALIALYLVVTWILFRQERGKIALLPFIGGALFLAPLFLG